MRAPLPGKARNRVGLAAILQSHHVFPHLANVPAWLHSWVKECKNTLFKMSCIVGTHCEMKLL